MPSKIYTKELLEPIVKACTTYSEVVRRLTGKISFHASQVTYISRLIKKFGIDTEHMLGQAYARGSHSNKRIPASKRLVLRPVGSRREPYSRLHSCLQEIGRLHVCSCCGQKSVWNEKPLNLQIDHENGLVWDDRPENLRYLCPNCHSQTETYGAKNTRKEGWLNGYSTRFENEHVPVIPASEGSSPSPSAILGL